MRLTLPFERGNIYASNSQRIRVITEDWVEQSAFCPNCGNHLSSFENNRPVADFYCTKCNEEYELKSKHGNIGTKIVDGAYSSMIGRLVANNNPNFFFLTYDKVTFAVKDFFTIPKYFFVPGIIEVRPALSPMARRAGWVGCNIVMSNIPDFGKIFYVQNGVAKSKTEILENWSKTEFVGSTRNIDAKGWLLDVLLCVEKIRKTEFSLEDVYDFESYLKTRHPTNNNVKAKIRQQLQVLRDRHVIEFVGRGQYRMRAIQS